MRPSRCAALAAALLVTPALLAGQTSTAPPRQATNSDAARGAAARIEAHVRFLADDLLEGREAGTRGYDLAARYVASQLSIAGARPVTPGGSYLLPVGLHEVRSEGAVATLELNGPAGTERFTHGDAVLIAGAMEGGAVAVEAPLVFVGYGVEDAALGWDDYAGLDVRGRIAVLLMGPSKGIDSEVAAHLLAEASATAARHGAIASIAIPTRGLAAVLPWDAMVGMMKESRPTTWVTKDGVPFVRAKGAKAGALAGPKAAAALFARAPRSLDEVLAEADTAGGRPKGFVLPGTAKLTVTTEVRRYESAEVVGVIEGSDQVLKQEYVALTAHADHIGVSRSGDGDRINNGALDNAMGTAMLIEVARAFTQGARPRRSILLIAHTAEEKGLLGAHFLAANPPVPVDRIVASINLDMPVLLHDFSDVIAFGASHSDLEEALRAAAQDAGVALSPDPMPDQAIFVRSDHYAMVKVGVPSVMLSPGMASGGDQAFGLFLGKHYHKPSDDLALPIRWDAAARFADLNRRILERVANSPKRVRWYEGDYFGNAFAPGAPKAKRPEGGTSQPTKP